METPNYNPKLLARLMDCQDMAYGERDDALQTPEQFAHEYRTNEDILSAAEDIFSSYFEDGHMNCDLKEECPSAWRNQTARIKRLIAATKKEIAKEDN
jgi:hypothetical protein